MSSLSIHLQTLQPSGGQEKWVDMPTMPWYSLVFKLQKMVKWTTMEFVHLLFRSETWTLTSGCLEFSAETWAPNSDISVKIMDGCKWIKSEFQEKTCFKDSSVLIEKVVFLFRVIWESFIQPCSWLESCFYLMPNLTKLVFLQSLWDIQLWEDSLKTSVAKKKRHNFLTTKLSKWDCSHFWPLVLLNR